MSGFVADGVNFVAPVPICERHGTEMHLTDEAGEGQPWWVCLTCEAEMEAVEASLEAYLAANAGPAALTGVALQAWSADFDAWDGQAETDWIQGGSQL